MSDQVTKLSDYIEMPDQRWKRSFRRQLRGWYARHARDLPWRRTRDPYHIWLSEVMLQQTQVATVIPYFERFVTMFPTVGALAAADEPLVLRQWEGLGYYRRARQLHNAAKQIVSQHQGVFPRDPAAVAQLPGVGRYTRGAILSIAFDQREPILEANTIRLHSRLLAMRQNPISKQGQTWLWSFAEAILPRRDVGMFNQALMELGGAICVPQSPRCLVCPVASLCPTRALGLQGVIPTLKAKVAYEDLEETAVVVYKRAEVLLRRCQEGERWAGLWDFPRIPTPRSNPRQLLADRVKEMTGIDIEVGESITTLKHAVTRYRITLTCRTAQRQGGRLLRNADLVWVRPEALDAYPLSVTGRKIAKLLPTS